MVTGFPGKSDCCIFPAVREQQVSGSLTPSPEPLGRAPAQMWRGSLAAAIQEKPLCIARPLLHLSKILLSLGVSPRTPQTAHLELGSGSWGSFIPRFWGPNQTESSWLQTQTSLVPTHLPAWGPGSDQESHTEPVGSGDKDPPAKPLPASLPLVPVPLHSHSNSNKLLVMSRVSLRAESL